MTDHILHATGEIGDRSIAISTSDRGGLCQMVAMVDGAVHTAKASDFFAALCRLREGVLEPMGLQLVCYGASLDIWPSAMARSMGQGLRAYQMTMGAQAEHLVDIFDTCRDVIPATVADQR